MSRLTMLARIVADDDLHVAVDRPEEIAELGFGYRDRFAESIDITRVRNVEGAPDAHDK